MKKSEEFIKQRELQIIDYINDKKFVTVDELCEVFSMSASTARKQLSNLDERKVITRTHGGAKSYASSEVKLEPMNSLNNIKNLKEKQAIAKMAVSFVSKRDIIALCGGTSTYLMAKELVNCEEITVVTNSIWVANELSANKKIDVRVCGGILDHSKGSLIGAIAESFYQNMHFDKAFIGADAVDVDYGITSGDTRISHLETAICKKSKNVYILADHTKFTKPLTIDTVLSSQDIGILITDSGISSSLLNIMNSNNVNIITAK